MDPHPSIARRANLEDLASLKGLWDIARLPTLELEKHLTEFQVVTRPDGVLLGAVAMRIQGHHGLIHSEAFYHPETEDQYRPAVWERLQVLARNHGLVRLWTREGSPFWHQAGFKQASDEELAKLPKGFGDPHAVWFTLPLRAEKALSPDLEKEFELFQLAQRSESERVMRQARVLKWVAGVIALAFFAGALALLFSLYRTSASRRRQ